MSWKSNGAFTRLANTFKRLYDKKLIYKEDIEALKTLQETVNELVAQNITEQTLFAKLVCANLYYAVIRYGNIKEAIKMIQMDLDLPLTSQLQNLTNELNLQELTSLMKSKGIEFDIPESLESKNKNLELISKHEKEFVSKVLNSWKYDDVKKSFEKTVNEFITNPENYSI